MQVRIFPDEFISCPGFFRRMESWSAEVFAMSCLAFIQGFIGGLDQFVHRFPVFGEGRNPITEGTDDFVCGNHERILDHLRQEFLEFLIQFQHIGMVENPHELIPSETRDEVAAAGIASCAIVCRTRSPTRCP